MFDNHVIVMTETCGFVYINEDYPHAIKPVLRGHIWDIE